MTRKVLADAVRQAATQLGYAFFSGFDYRMNQEVIAYPAVWMSPPKIIAVEGRLEGRIRYRITLNLMQICRTAAPESREQLWRSIEEDALEIYRVLEGDRRIVSAAVAECVQGELSLTNHGEISMALKLDVEVPFCKL